MNSKIEKVHEQYEFARQNLDSIKKVAPADASSGKDGEQDYMTLFLNQMFQLVKRVIYMFAAFIVFLYVFNKVNKLFFNCLSHPELGEYYT